MNAYSNPLLTAGRIVFSSTAVIYAVMLFAIASLSTEFAEDSDVLRSNSDVGVWDVFVAIGIGLAGVVMALGAAAAWTRVLPMRNWLIGATAFGVVTFTSIWALNALGVTDVYV